MERTLGTTYAHSYASDVTLTALGSRTVQQALADGDDVKSVWQVVCAALAEEASATSRPTAVARIDAQASAFD
jgi:hypothetical protein